MIFQQFQGVNTDFTFSQFGSSSNFIQFQTTMHVKKDSTVIAQFERKGKFR